MSVLVDVLIVLVLLGCLVHGFRRGLVGSVGSIVGLVAGAIAAAFVAPPAAALVPDAAWRPAAALAVALVLVLFGTGVGARIGSALGAPVRRSALGPVDRVLGAALQLIAGALAVTVLAGLAVVLGPPQLAQPIAGSAVVREVEALTPAPVAHALDGLRSTVLAGGAPLLGTAVPSPR